MSSLRVFVDSDAIISSLISDRGAAYFLLNKKLPKIRFFISNASFKEQKIVVKRLKINKKRFQGLIKKRLTIVRLEKSIDQLKKKYQAYTLDPDDAHVVAGAQKSKAKFLITYNQRHFRKDKIKKDLGILLLTPAQFLQYLRSRGQKINNNFYSPPAPHCACLTSKAGKKFGSSHKKPPSLKYGAGYLLELHPFLV